MAALTQLDTHVLMWLYEPRTDLPSQLAANAIEDGDLAVSPIAAAELTHLHEVGRIAVDAPTVLSSLERQVGLRLDDTSFERVVFVVHSMTWTRDPFDRLIAAQALASDARLVTSDKTIRANLRVAVW